MEWRGPAVLPDAEERSSPPGSVARGSRRPLRAIRRVGPLSPDPLPTAIAAPVSPAASASRLPMASRKQPGRILGARSCLARTATRQGHRDSHAPRLQREGSRLAARAPAGLRAPLSGSASRSSEFPSGPPAARSFLSPARPPAESSWPESRLAPEWNPTSGVEPSRGGGGLPACWWAPPFTDVARQPAKDSHRGARVPRPRLPSRASACPSWGSSSTSLRPGAEQAAS